MATKQSKTKQEIADFLGKMILFRNPLKLTLWSITGKGGYEAHISLDQATESLIDITDRLIIERSFLYPLYR